MKRLTAIIFTLTTLILQAQSNSEPDSSVVKIDPKTITQFTLIEEDTIFWDFLDEVLIISSPTFDNDEARRRYYILRRKVMKVYPYAVLAGNKLDSLNLKLDDINRKRQRKKYIKEYQKFLEEKFEPELKKLTRTEGQILSKLIYRETNMTVFDLIKEYRNGWSAFWWNASASWYDIDLKEPYRPTEDNEDRLIENILLRSFSSGLLYERVPFYPPKK
jgi:hypothetical protein